jgi:hypothetical protein
MTLTFPWWAFPLASVLGGFALMIYFALHPRGDFDLVSPMVGAACFLVGLTTAIAMVVGKLWL